MKTALSKKQLSALLIMACCHVVALVVNFPEFLHGRSSGLLEKIVSITFLAMWFILAFLMRKDLWWHKFSLVYAAMTLICGLLGFFEVANSIPAIAYPLIILFLTPYDGLKVFLDKNYTVMQIGIPILQLLVSFIFLSQIKGWRLKKNK